MRVEKVEGVQERRILIGMITDPVVLARIAPKWDAEAFASRWCCLVGGWCVSHFLKYGQVPGKGIEARFETWAAKSKDDDTILLVDRFLSGLSNEYEQLGKESNSDYLVDLAAEYFNKVRLARLAEFIQGDLDNGEADKALKRVHQYSRIEMNGAAGIDVLQDIAAMEEAFTKQGEALIKYPGALGHFFGTSLERDGFIAFEGPEKRGKTWMLLDVAWRAMLQRCKVAFFSVGDMSQNQMMRRFMVRAARQPFKLKGGFPGKVLWPKHLEKNGEGMEVDHKVVEFPDPLTMRDAKEACRAIIHEQVKTTVTLLKLSTHPNSSINVQGIVSELQAWERSGWVPDVIVIDYADILAPPAGVAETRDQINMTWKQLRALSQSMHCLVVTATQSDTESYKVETLSMRNFSEDKRKNAHVTGMVGLNQTKEEKDKGLMRLNWVALREGEYSDTQCCYVASCLPLANPTVRSCF